MAAEFKKEIKRLIASGHITDTGAYVLHEVLDAEVTAGRLTTDTDQNPFSINQQRDLPSWLSIGLPVLIRRWRGGKTRADFVESVDVTARTIQYIEDGDPVRGNPKIGTFVEIAQKAGLNKLGGYIAHYLATSESGEK